MATFEAEDTVNPSALQANESGIMLPLLDAESVAKTAGVIEGQTKPAFLRSGWHYDAGEAP